MAEVEAEAEAERRASTDDYMPAAGTDSHEVDAGPSSAVHSPRSALSAHSAAFGPPGSVDELRMHVATTAAILRMCIDAGPGPDQDAARAAADAEANLAAALTVGQAHPGGLIARPLPQPLRAIYKAPPTVALAWVSGSPQLAHGVAAAETGPAEDPAPPAVAAAGDPGDHGGALAGPVDAAAIPVAETGRGPAACRPSLGGKGGAVGEVDARRGFIEAFFSQPDAGTAHDGRGPAAQVGSGDGDSVGSDI